MTRVILLPKQVEVGSFVFPIHVVPPDHPRLGGDSDGCTTFSDEEGGYGIYIAATLPLRQGLETVLHEVTHAINYAQDIEGGEDEETITRKHGAAWSQFFLDNPKFQRWLVYVLNRIRKERQHA